MKARTSIFIFAIIGLSVLGWRDHRKLAELKQDRDRLSARAAELGIPEEAIHITKRPRPDRDSEARVAAKNFILHHKKREAIKLAGGDPETSPETAARAFDWMALLNSKQIRVVIGEILDDPELDDKSRRRLIGRSAAYLSKKDPAGALALFSIFSDHLKDTGLGRQVVRKSLGSLSKENPHAAITWARDHMNEFPGIIKSTQDLLISNTALQDPALAFEITREFGHQRSAGDTEASILSAAKPEIRTMVLAAFRQHLAALGDDEERRKVEQQAWTGLARGIARDGFESGSKWLTAANPTPDDLHHILERIGTGLANSSKEDETGLWLEWIAETLPDSEGDKHIFEMMKYWTDRDHEAAGNWLVSAPESPARNVAIRSYAQMVFKYDPDTALQWIMTLPPDQDRNHTLKTLHINWPKDDPAGARAFAKEHGIE